MGAGSTSVELRGPHEAGGALGVCTNPNKKMNTDVRSANLDGQTKNKESAHPFGLRVVGLACCSCFKIVSKVEDHFSLIRLGVFGHQKGA